ncbi:MAG: autotransporter outer membrane beta-barrel domain-containing protein, partial [Akkermansiaceae bacterium]|nr:autotransporter outer membrane beta-barrel domain-containing protein [Akkermansiaceae bacterium]
VERQLRAIRNRTTTMGVNPCVVNEGMPYFNAWINAEGNRGELDKDGTMPGYTLDSWGGTVGFDVDVNPGLTLGMAVTAMYGDLTTDGPDMLEGDMDTYYVSAFARYTKRAWSHTFVATVGKMDATYERTVSHAGGSYMAEGDTDGTAFGLMYEVARSYTLDSDGNVGGQLVANVAYRHTTVSGYEETGRDAALKVDDQTLDTITFGVGGRMQAVVGENLFNRTSVFEARALAKFDVGDRSSEADVAFLGGSRSATVESAELGAFGVELGAGLSIPVGNVNDGTIFFDVSAELRSGYTNVNGTVGYRINF